MMRRMSIDGEYELDGEWGRIHITIGKGCRAENATTRDWSATIGVFLAAMNDACWLVALPKHDSIRSSGSNHLRVSSAARI